MAKQGKGQPFPPYSRFATHRSLDLNLFLLVAVHSSGIETLFAVAKFRRGGGSGPAERHRAIEAGAPAGVAGAGAGLLDLDPYGVLVAIDAHLGHALDVARCLALAPQCLPRAAEVPSLASLDGAGQRLGIHVRHHE